MIVDTFGDLERIEDGKMAEITFVIRVVTAVCFGIVALVLVRKVFILSFKCEYYKQKLVNRGVDTSSVDRIGLFGICKM